MPPFCEFFHLSAAQYWDTEDEDREAMVSYMTRAIEARSHRG